MAEMTAQERRVATPFFEAAPHDDFEAMRISEDLLQRTGEALMTDVGFTGGGAGSGMVYLAGKQSHKLSNDEMIDHIVEQVETRAAQLEQG